MLSHSVMLLGEGKKKITSEFDRFSLMEKFFRRPLLGYFVAVCVCERVRICMCVVVVVVFCWQRLKSH